MLGSDRGDGGLSSERATLGEKGREKEARRRPSALQRTAARRGDGTMTPARIAGVRVALSDGMDPQHHSESEPTRALTQAQREELRQTLEEKRKHLLHALREHEDSAEERDDAAERDPGDAADRAGSAVDDNDRIAMADHDLELLEEVDHALTRMDAGTYGLSEASGRPIPYERLRAVPWARYEAEEAERIERASRTGSAR